MIGVNETGPGLMNLTFTHEWAGWTRVGPGRRPGRSPTARAYACTYAAGNKTRTLGAPGGAAPGLHAAAPAGLIGFRKSIPYVLLVTRDSVAFEEPAVLILEARTAMMLHLAIAAARPMEE